MPPKKSRVRKTPLKRKAPVKRKTPVRRAPRGNNNKENVNVKQQIVLSPGNSSPQQTKVMTQPMIIQEPARPFTYVPPEFQYGKPGVPTRPEKVVERPPGVPVDQVRAMLAPLDTSPVKVKKTRIKFSVEDLLQKAHEEGVDFTEEQRKNRETMMNALYERTGDEKFKIKSKPK